MPTPKPYLTADGRTTYRVRFRLGTSNNSETFPTERKALEFCRDVEDLGAARAVQRLEERTQRTDEPDVRTLFESFIQWKAPRVRSDRTIADYRRDFDNWIAPTFGHRLAALVTVEDVQEWVDKMVDGRIAGTRGKASAKSIGDRHALLHAVMGWAFKRKIIGANPCTETELPKKVKSNPKGLTPAEWDAFYRAMRQGDSAAADLTLFLVASGWRWSEATALTTFDVEDDGQRVWVTMNRVMRRDAKSVVRSVEDGKGEGSLRRIELDEEAAEMVRARVARQSPGGLVFTTSVSLQNGLGGNPWHYGNFRDRHWLPAVKAANLSRRPTPHWLRHTAVYFLSLSGAGLPELQSRIGHRSITTTINTYGRMLTDVSPDVLGRAAAIRRRNSGTNTPDRRAIGEDLTYDPAMPSVVHSGTSQP